MINTAVLQDGYMCLSSWIIIYMNNHIYACINLIEFVKSHILFNILYYVYK